MKRIIVTHKASDLDAVTSAWLIKRFLPGWDTAEIQFVPAGSKLLGNYTKKGDAIEVVDGAEVIHVDTGMGPLDHHQTENSDVCATSLAFEYVKNAGENGLLEGKIKTKALSEMVEYVVDDDHFQEIFFINPTASVYDFSLVSLLHGIKAQYPKDDVTCMRFGMDMLDAALHSFENKIWALEEIEEKGIKFATRWGEALAVETLNDTILKLGQQAGFVITVRKDPTNGAIRIKARPTMRNKYKESKFPIFEHVDVDLTSVYEQLQKMDPEASWYLHVSKRMLLNGSSKNPTMRGSKLSLDQVVEILKTA